MKELDLYKYIYIFSFESLDIRLGQHGGSKDVLQFLIGYLVNQSRSFPFMLN
jgi:hypothetical protein